MPKTAHIVLGAPAEQAVFPEPRQGDSVIGVDRGAFECLSRDIGVTIAVGDFDSVTPEEKAALRSSAESFHEFDSDKDDTDAEIALKIAVNDETVSDIRIYNWSGGRLDHLLSIFYMVYQPRFKKAIGRMTLYNKTNTITFYPPGSHTLVKDTARQYLSFIGMTPIEELTLRGVKYPLDKESYSYPRALVSNEFLEKECRFSFSTGLLAVIQSGDK
ncbi:thiamine diphosphokinase [Alkalibacterium putridalgicola]|uniref:Thiamine diphosphokinase n=1 Tax=Alkalibacterium putridalgicola TaxID=426703 RepID=A0A1H7Q2X6_9LACT|nr:thiamine diphosphokinase [Alkalibacterium putridalgicola]GEK88055.1 thiamine pyrophosphokinase [Alkalibacterium putridalgicola]SEL42501.1 thiamine pyrophosphokinase [Alkalibacterium putridalgicola]